jgi:hypothetical protein
MLGRKRQRSIAGEETLRNMYDLIIIGADTVGKWVSQAPAILVTVDSVG